MDSIGAGTAAASVGRPDIMIATTAARPTPKPPRMSFGEVLAAGAGVAVQGAQSVMGSLPGSSVAAAGVRQGGGASPMVMQAQAEGPGVGGGANPASGLSLGGGAGTGGLSLGGVSVSPESSTSGTGGDASMATALAQSQQMSLYYLQLQQTEDAQNRQFTAESNIEKTRHDTAKNAIGNVGQ